MSSCEAQGTPAQSHVFSALTCDESVKLRFTRSRPYSLELEWVDGAGGNGWRVDGNGSRK